MPPEETNATPKPPLPAPEDCEYVLQLAKNMRRNAEGKLWAQAFCDGELLNTPRHLARYIALLQSDADGKWRTKQIAAWLLGRQEWSGEMREIAIANLNAFLKKRADKERSPQKNDDSRFGAFLTLVVFVSLAYPLRHAIAEFFLTSSLFYRIIVGYVGYCALKIPFKRLFPGSSISEYPDKENRAKIAAYTEALLALKRFQDIQSIEVFANLLHASDYVIRSEARAALVSLLPKLREQNVALISNDVIQALCNSLSLCPKEILQALSAIKDTRAIRPLERAQKTYKGSAFAFQIEQTLETLYMQRAKEKENSLLLRASSANQEATHLLLRPQAKESVSAENLLRPSQSDTQD